MKLKKHSCKELSDGTVISRLCPLSDVAVIDFQGFWLGLLKGHIISCMQTKEDIVNKHYNSADSKSFKSFMTQRSHKKNVCCN